MQPKKYGHGFLVREYVIKAIRQFFDEQGFHEVLVPVLSDSIPTEPNIYPFATEWGSGQGTRQLFMSTSPERGIKQVLAAGVEKCYSLGKCFRNMEGAGHRHRPEFLMLEWYRERATYHDIMADTQALVKFVKKYVWEKLGRNANEPLTYRNETIDLEQEWPVFSLENLFKKHVGVEFASILTDEAMVKLAHTKGYDTTDATWSQLFDQLYLNEVEQKLPNTPYFIDKFPTRLSPLCQVNPTKPYLAQRFEVFLGGMEIGNGNNENTNGGAIEASFSKEISARQKRGKLTSPLDQAFLEAIKTMSQSHYAGIGLGVDRLAMIMADEPDIENVDFFALPVAKP